MLDGCLVLAIIFAVTSIPAEAEPPPGAPPEVEVVVTNTPLPVTVENDGDGARIPYVETKSRDIADGDPSASVQMLRSPDDFPEGYSRLVIETISYTAAVPAGQGVAVTVIAQGVEPLGVGYFRMPQVAGYPAANGTVYRDTMSVRGYASTGEGFNGTAVSGAMGRTSDAGEGEFEVTVFGYFLPDDSASLAP
jgi:hypothetical protein